MEFIQTLIANQLVVSILLSALPLVFIVLMVLVVLYTEMKVAAHIQDRVAYMRTGWHGVLQPIADMLKLLQKEDIIPTKADRAFISRGAIYRVYRNICCVCRIAVQQHLYRFQYQSWRILFSCCRLSCSNRNFNGWLGIEQ